MGNIVMIYKILDKEEIGEFKEELFCGLLGMVKVYIYCYGLCFEFLVFILFMNSIEIIVFIVIKLIFFFDYVF